MEALTLLSTVVAPAFRWGRLTIQPVASQDLPALLGRVSRNLCGHPVTEGVLRALAPSLPAPERGFWDGATPGLAVRPRGGVRGATGADVEVGLEDLEACLVTWEALEPPT